jgi:aspartate ammonia-lyase
MSKKKVKVTDSMGPVEIPASALYQAQTQRALDNFKISSLRLPVEMIQALAMVKKACAEVNLDLANIDTDDMIGLYLKEVGRVPLLTAQEEVDLAQRIEKGRISRSGAPQANCLE